MKTINIIAIMLGLSVTQVYAQTTNTTTAAQQQSTASTSQAQQGNAQNITYNNPGQQAYSGTYGIKTVPGVAAPGLTTTLTETCMGSTTGGVAIMGLGLSGGSTWKDEECVRRLNARELAQTLGEKDAAKELLCGNQEINAVYQSLGRPCLMAASTSIAIPGGALINYRDPVAPRPTASHYVQPVVAQVPVQQLPIANQIVHDDQDLTAQDAQTILKKADAAREAMRLKGF